MIFEGALSVKAILEQNKRTINKVYIQDKKRSKNISYILHLCHKNNVEFEFVDKAKIDSLAAGKSHGGILIDAHNRESEELDLTHDFYLYLEGIEDPYNIGQIIRTATIAGCQSIIMSERDYSSLENTILKSSAGLFEQINWVITDAKASNLVQLRQAGVKLVIAKRDEKSKNLYEIDFTQPHCLCIGGEKRGLSKIVEEMADESVEIRYPTQTRVALDATSSSAILCFEVVRQRMEN